MLIANIASNHYPKLKTQHWPNKTYNFWDPLTQEAISWSIRSMVCNIFAVVALDEMKYMHVPIWVEVKMRGINCRMTIRIVILPSTIKLFSITQSTKGLDMLTTKKYNMAMCSYIYYGTFQYCQIHFCNDYICMLCKTWIDICMI